MKRLAGLALVCLIGLAVFGQTEEVDVEQPWDFFIGEWRNNSASSYIHAFTVAAGETDYLRGQHRPVIRVFWSRIDDDPVFGETVIAFGSSILSLFPNDDGELVYGVAEIGPSSNNPMRSYLRFERNTQSETLRIRIFMSRDAALDIATEGKVIEMVLSRYESEP